MKERVVRRIVRKEIRSLEERGEFKGIVRLLRTRLPTYDSIQQVKGGIKVADGPSTAIVTYNHGKSAYVVKGDGTSGGLAEEVFDLMNGEGYNTQIK